MYFDQQTHACACIHMVENNEKRLKIIKKVLFSLYARETHVRLTQEHEEKCSFFSVVVYFNQNISSRLLGETLLRKGIRA